MTLLGWWRVLAVGAVVGAAALAVLGWWASRAHGAYEAEVRSIGLMQYRANEVSVKADALLIEAFDEGAWVRFVSLADALVADLAPFVVRGGAAADAVDAVQRLVAAVEEVVASDAVAAVDVLERVGPLGVGVDAAASMQRVAGIGVELEDAFDALLREGFNAGIGRANAAARAFAAAALVFVVLSVVVLYVFRRRVGAPLSALVAVADRVSAGDHRARAAVASNDEVGLLARSMNAMLDALAESERVQRGQALALEREKESLAASQRIAHVATWSWSPEDDLVTLSEEAFAIVGRAPDGAPVPVETLVSIAHVEDRERLVYEMVEPLREGRKAAGTYRTVRPDGSLRTLRVHGEPRRCEDGSVRVSGTVQDVTEEYERRRSAETDARLLEAAGRVARFGGWSVDTRTWAMRWSDVVCEIHEEPLGTAPAPERGIEYYAPEHRERIREAFEACVRDGVPYDVELQIVTARGRRVWVRTTGEAVRDEQGVVVRVEGAFQDVDASKHAELRASASERRLRETIESLADPFVLVDRDGTIAFANAAATVHADGSAASVQGVDVGAVFAASLPSDQRVAFERAFVEREPFVAEVWVPESERWFEVRLDPVDGLTAFQARDVTDRRVMLERMQQHEHELRVSRDALAVALESRGATFDALPANVAVLDDRGVIRYVNDGWRRFAEVNGLDHPDHMVGESYLEVVERAAEVDESAVAAAFGLRQLMAGEVASVDLEYPCHGPEREAWFRMSARRIEGGANGNGRVVVMHVDITERMLAERSLAFVAHHDPLTSLYSRAGFAHHVGRALREHWRPHCVVAAIDLSGFRSINDAHGYATGDAVLKAVAERLRGAVGDDGFAARVGGDSFAVFFRVDPGQGGAEQAVQGLVESVFGSPVAVEDFVLQLDVALGFTRLGADVRAMEDLLREAEVALYDGVNAVDGGVAAYSSELDAASRARVRITSELKQALALQEFELHYQPKVELSSGALLAAEALVRWRHPERGLVMPGAFIEVAEQSGLIAPIGSWVLEEACRTMAAWRADGLPRVRVAVNVSMRQLVQGDLVAEVERVIERFAVAAEDLTLEITESVYGSESLHLRRQLHRLHAMGVRLALDDFGTGFSSLQYLKAYRFDEVKIDRSFVRDMVRDAYSRHVVETILSIARAIGAEAVAEGIETPRQREMLERMGCRIGQGYLFSAPVPEDDVRWLLRGGATLPIAVDVAAVRGARDLS